MTKYNPSVHSVERIRERFGIMEEHAKQFVNDLMSVAKYVTTQPDGKTVYKHAGRDAMIVVDERTSTIVTVLPPNSAKPQLNASNPFYTDIRRTIERKITKARRQFTREFRSLSESQALIQIEIAEMSLRKIRAKNPNTQAVIQSKIDVALTLFDEIGSAINELQSEFAKVQREANEFLPTEVTA